MAGHLFVFAVLKLSTAFPLVPKPSKMTRSRRKRE